VAQVVEQEKDPEFKPQYCQKKEREGQRREGNKRKKMHGIIFKKGQRRREIK
jgi:hypothetical protein